MDRHELSRHEARLEEILYSSAGEAAKAQQIVRLGFDQEVADELVERHALGSQMPDYYETLAFHDEDDRALPDQPDTTRETSR